MIGLDGERDHDHWISGILAGELDCFELIRNQTRILNIEDDPYGPRRCARVIMEHNPVMDAPSRDLVEHRGWAGIERVAGIGLAEDLVNWLRDYDTGWWAACLALAAYEPE